MNGKYVKLGAVADMLSGFAFKSAQFLDAANPGVKLVRGDNVQQGSIRWGEKTKKWSSDSYDELQRYHLKENDILLAMDRPIVGGGLKLAWIKEQDLPCLLVQRVTRIRGLPSAALTTYLRYALSTPKFLSYIDSVTTGANIPHISGKDIACFKFWIPSIEVQERTAELLITYDNANENNSRRIALLEESARLLFREWFVNLRFPGHTATKNITGLPAGWDRATIADQASFLGRGISPTYDENAKWLIINQKCIRNGCLNLVPARRQSKEVKAERLLQVGDILINSTGAGTLGRVAQVRSEIPSCTVDSHVTIVRPKEDEAAGFLGVALLEMESLLETLGVGSTNQLELGRERIGALALLLPPPVLQQEFHDRVWPWFTQVETLSQSNAVLSQARDALLPKLMSGELRV